jgi:uncharacterized protein (DUF342 family)
MSDITVNELEQLKNEVEKAENSYKEAKKRLAEQKANEVNITEEQFNGSTDAIIKALNTLSEQLEVASTKGSIKAKQIVEGFGGESKFNEFIVTLAGYIGSTVATGGAVGAMPMIVMAGAARGVYRKIVE